MSESLRANLDPEAAWVSLLLDDMPDEERVRALARMARTPEETKELARLRRLARVLAHLPEGALSASADLEARHPAPPLPVELASKLKSIPSCDERMPVGADGAFAHRIQPRTPRMRGGMRPGKQPNRRSGRSVMRHVRNANGPILAGGLLALLVGLMLQWNPKLEVPETQSGHPSRLLGTRGGLVLKGAAPATEASAPRFRIHFLTRRDASAPITLLAPRLVAHGPDAVPIPREADVLLVLSGDIPIIPEEKKQEHTDGRAEPTPLETWIRLDLSLRAEDGNQEAHRVLLDKRVTLSEVPNMEGYFTNVEDLRIKLDDPPGLYRLTISLSKDPRLGTKDADTAPEPAIENAAGGWIQDVDVNIVPE